MKTSKIKNATYEYKLIAKTLITEETTPIRDSQDTYKFLISSVYDKDDLDVRESFYAVFLDARANIKGFIKVSEGGINRCPVDPKIIFSAALKCLASSIVISHNHPTGDCTPSQYDKKLTKQLNDVAKLLEIQLLDHIIVSRRNYYSFNDNFRIEH